MTTDAWEAIHIGVEIILAAGIFWVGRKANGFDALKKQVEENAAEIIDSKLKLHAAEAAGQFNLIRQLFDTLKEELCNSSKNIDEQDKEKDKLEIKTGAQLSELKQYVVTNCASKGDVDRIAEQVVQLRISMGQVFPYATRRLPATELENQ